MWTYKCGLDGSGFRQSDPLHVTDFSNAKSVFRTIGCQTGFQQSLKNIPNLPRKMDGILHKSGVDVFAYMIS